MCCSSMPSYMTTWMGLTATRRPHVSLSRFFTEEAAKLCCGLYSSLQAVRCCHSFEMSPSIFNCPNAVLKISLPCVREAIDSAGRRKVTDGQPFILSKLRCGPQMQVNDWAEQGVYFEIDLFLLAHEYQQKWRRQGKRCACS